jgi:hypothetical protein
LWQQQQQQQQQQWQYQQQRPTQWQPHLLQWQQQPQTPWRQPQPQQYWQQPEYRLPRLHPVELERQQHALQMQMDNSEAVRLAFEMGAQSALGSLTGSMKSTRRVRFTHSNFLISRYYHCLLTDFISSRREQRKCQKKLSETIQSVLGVCTVMVPPVSFYSQCWLLTLLVALFVGGSVSGQRDLIIKLLKDTKAVESFFMDSPYLQK